MGRFKARHKFLNDIFNNEDKIAKSEDAENWLKVICETYDAAKQKNLQIAEIAHRRFRRKEFYIYTCIMRGISPAKYYRLLSIFFKIAEKQIETIFGNENRFKT